MTERGWWFGYSSRVLPHGDGRPIVIGETLTVEGELELCRNGLHWSKRPLDALSYVCDAGLVAYRVEASGEILRDGDKCCSRGRTALGAVEADPILRHFARLCALDVIHLWDAPDVVVRYLKTGDESIRQDAGAAAWAAAWAARDAAWAAQDAARDAAWAAAGAARDAAWAAARAAAWDAAWAAARDAAWAAAGDAQNKRLYRMLMDGIRRSR